MDDRPEEAVERIFHYEGGIKEYVEYLNRPHDVLYPDIIYCEGIKDDVYVEVAMQHNNSYTESCYSFVNNIITPEGGTHLIGFRNCLLYTSSASCSMSLLLKKRLTTRIPRVRNTELHTQ